jgi:hypothetical protein
MAGTTLKNYKGAKSREAFKVGSALCFLLEGFMNPCVKAGTCLIGGKVPLTVLYLIGRMERKDGMKR